MTTKVHLGSISRGTLRAEDLIPCFIDTLTELIDSASLLPSSATFEETERCKTEHTRITNFLAAIEQRMSEDNASEYTDEETGEGDYFSSEDASWNLEQLQDELNAFAPPFCYFGAHEGDGSDFGFWVSDDSLRDAEHDGELIRCDERPDDYGEASYALVVSDHGNMELYDREGNSIWGIV